VRDRNSKSPALKVIYFLLAAGLFIAGVCFSNSELTAMGESNSSKARLVPPPRENIELLAFGFNDIFADSLWLRTIQNLDVCDVMGVSPVDLSAAVRERFQNRVQSPSTHLDPHVAAALKNIVPRRGRCSQGWAFQMMDAATRLAPRFEIVYSAGGAVLSVMMDDYEGATILYERGLKAAPKNWIIAYRAAYHYFYDLQDFSRAAELLTQAGKNGGPLWLRSLAARLFTQSGQAHLALPLLKQLRDETVNPIAKKDLDDRISQLEDLVKRESE
jgi:tetratricopeptide (TPR) repeat protein